MRMKIKRKCSLLIIVGNVYDPEPEVLQASLIPVFKAI